MLVRRGKGAPGDSSPALLSARIASLRRPSVSLRLPACLRVLPEGPQQTPLRLIGGTFFRISDVLDDRHGSLVPHVHHVAHQRSRLIAGSGTSLAAPARGRSS